MSDRKRLVEAMARSLHPGIWDGEPETSNGKVITRLNRSMAKSMARDCVEAAERAGFEFRMKEIEGE